MENGKTPEQALNYLEGLGIVVQNGRPFHNIEAIQCVAILKEFIPVGPSENGKGSQQQDDPNKQVDEDNHAKETSTEN